MKQRAKEIIEHGNHLFSKRSSLLSTWQEIAEYFYYERANFTGDRSLGSEYSQYSITSIPALHRREMANLVQGMLRPRDKQWFEPRLGYDDLNEKTEVQRVTEHIGDVMKRAMYDRHTNFANSTKIGDHDFVTFGQAVLTCEVDRGSNMLLYRDWHLKDVAWSNDHRGVINTIHHNKVEQARNLVRQFPKTVSQKVKDTAEKSPFTEIKTRYICIPADEYEESGLSGRRPRNAKYACIYVEMESETILSEGWMKDHPYIIPRWQCHGSQYATSPAVVIALPDAKTLWGMVETLYRAGEKAVDPPMVAVQELMRSDIGIGPGEISYVDAEFDGKLREVLQSMPIDSSGLRFGAGMVDKQEQVIMRAFYLDRINLPPVGPGMTATEIRARMEEYVRTALPLFEPMETEYNGQLCEKTFNLLMDENAFGDIREWPREMFGEEVQWQFNSPISQAQRRQDAATLQEVIALLGVAAQVDPSVAGTVNMPVAFLDAARGLGAKGTWLVSEDEAKQAKEAAQGEMEMQQGLSKLGAGADAAKKLGEAANAFGMAAGV